MLLTIDKLVYGGDGLARLPADEHGRGKAVFVPFTLAGEQVEATIVENKPGFARARLDGVVTASPDRIDADCPYFQRCGGCQYQHTGYERQVAIKSDILRENLARLAKLSWSGEIVTHASPPWNYRNRARLQIRPGLPIGYYAPGSHQVVAVEQCPISSPLINRAIALVHAGRGDALAGFREVEFFADAADEHLFASWFLDPGGRPAGEPPTAGAGPAFAGLAGAAVFASMPTGTARAPKLLASFDAVTREPGAALTYSAAGHAYRVSPGAFFQTNRFLVDRMVELVCSGRSGKLALDLYAGVGLFSAILARAFERVVAVESSEHSADDLAHNVPANVEAVRDTTERYLARRTGRLDLVVVDPPRDGLGDKVTSALTHLAAPRMTYVSCDPATLARDLRALIAGGYRVEQIHLLDLFPQTFHIESVVQLAK